uniref:Caeridin-7.1 n=1 Tax=Litoria ewingii TaxID=104896 RepID=CDN71_LITEW|nr:RecName: Full=Caeridin-7.1 [Litoria ewingii]
GLLDMVTGLLGNL